MFLLIVEIYNGHYVSIAIKHSKWNKTWFNIFNLLNTNFLLFSETRYINEISVKSNLVQMS